jgi:hypothetical protein
MPIITKHKVNNKFYCISCQAVKNLVIKYDYEILTEDIKHLSTYVKNENIQLNFDLKNILLLEKVYSKTVMVLNCKIEEARQKFNIFIP